MEGEEEFNERNNKKKNDKNPTIYNAKQKAGDTRIQGKEKRWKAQSLPVWATFYPGEKMPFIENLIKI